MKHKTPILLFLALLALSALAGCSSSLETTYNTQSGKIEDYVSKQLDAHPEYRVVYNGGVVRMIVAEGYGDEIVRGRKVTFVYAGYSFGSYTVSNNYLFATNDADVAAAAKWDLSDAETRFQPVTVTLGKDKLVPGLEMGLEGVRPGEDSYIFFSGKYGFGKRQIGTIPASAPICYHVRIEDAEN